MSGAARPLQPATAFNPTADSPRGESPGPPNRPPGGRRQKRTLIESACSACRRRKSRCDGQRPSCSRCMNLRTDCQYEAEEGESRWSALRRRNQILETERDQLRGLVALLQESPDAEALELFHRLRSAVHEDVFELLRQIREGTVTAPHGTLHQLPGQHLPGPNAADSQRLPPIQAILDVTSLPGPPPSVPPELLHTQSTGSDDSRSSSHSNSLPNGRAMPMPEPLEPLLQHSAMPPHLPSMPMEDSIGSAGLSALDMKTPYHKVTPP